MKIKMRDKLIILILTTWLILLGNSTYAQKYKGTTGLSFLKVGIDPKVSSLGEAYTGVLGGVHSVNYNPAGITSLISKNQISLCYNRSFQDTNYGLLSYVKSRNLSGYGISLIYCIVDEIMETNIYNPQGTGKMILAEDLALIFTYGRSIGRISLGANLKLIKSTLDKETAFAKALDLGGIFRVTPNISFGISLKNLGTKISYIEKADPLPLNLKMGISFSLFKERIILLLDLNKPIDNEIYFNGGAEFNLFNLISLRAGFNSIFRDLGKGISAGLGFNLDKYSLDLSYTPCGDLGNMIRAGFSIRY